ncbi:hypothetical protein BDQ12DRAFT_426326 [Crucibulum laeve]|uniref:MARVEL domain-containing protein n=1 Tax=Crucibulum laeve TaxID=68775 RepID=A0A5C3M717_9AGAR|nr:hypothetical protein BDQ12DRAFT_426326 [Crucibulum laeve]
MLPILADVSLTSFSSSLPSSPDSLSLRKRPRRPLTSQSNNTTFYRRRRMSFIKAHYHPFLFTLMTLSAMAELGLTCFLVSAGNESGTWPTRRYHSLLILFVFNAAWTTLFSATYMWWFVDGSSHFLANIASSVAWLLITSVLWGTAAGVMHNTRTGGNCARRATISR